MSFNTTGIIKTRSKATYAIIEIWDKPDGGRQTIIVGWGYKEDLTDGRVARYNRESGPDVRYKRKIIEGPTPERAGRWVTLVDGE